MKSIDFARNDQDLFPILQEATSDEKAILAEIISNKQSSREGANKQVISSQADSLIKISRIWAD
ncbi:hypothetical protein ACQE50_26105, partial [Klebsiella pneumoniae]